MEPDLAKRSLPARSIRLSRPGGGGGAGGEGVGAEAVIEECTCDTRRER